ncbi:hypothetical protein KKE78_01240 [Patescibacteria group bacterium]|nr:hypothetical protein [Patescibacteria group bacterium]
MKIDDIQLRIISDSRGDKTLEVDLILEGQEALASVASGKSKGRGEAFVLDPELALNKLKEIKPELEKDFSSLEEFDNFLIKLDGTSEKKNLGGNLILALSIAFAKAWAKLQNLQTFQLIAQISKQDIKFPFCFFNLIEGGVHAQFIPGKKGLPFQEYLFIPKTNSPEQSLKQVNMMIRLLGSEIKKRYGELQQADEGGFIVPSKDQNPEIGLKILKEVFSKLLLKDPKINPAGLGLDVAASSFYIDGNYLIGSKAMKMNDLLSCYKQLSADYELFSIEDPFAEDDWRGFIAATKELGKEVWIIADDLTTTNVESIRLAQKRKAANAVIIKLNQIGSVTETIAATVLAKSYGWKIVVSHRSGETFDTFIADLAVGLGADGLKSGCPLQKERLVKYQRLIEIERICQT